jgi:hypothetical protein
MFKLTHYRSVIVGGQGSFDARAGLPVVPDRGVEGEQALEDPGAEPGRDAAAVALQAELPQHLRDKSPLAETRALSRSTAQVAAGYRG